MTGGMFHHDHQKPLLKQDFGGPKAAKRRCTDLLFVMLFITFWLGMIFTGTQAFKKFVHYLMHDTALLTYSACIDSISMCTNPCTNPNTLTLTSPTHTTPHQHSLTNSEQYKRVTNGWDREGNICGVGKCADYPKRFFPFDINMVSPYFSLCISECPASGDMTNVTVCDPNSNAGETSMNAQIMANIYAPYRSTESFFQHYCVPDSVALKADSAVTSGQTELTKFVKALAEADKVLMVSVGGAFVMAAVFLLLLRFCGGPIILVLLVAVIGAFAVAGRLLTTEKYVNADTSANVEKGMKIVGYCCYAFSALLVVVSFCIRRQLMMSVKVIEEGTHALAMNKRLLLVPVIKFVLLVGVLAFTCSSCASLVVGGEMNVISVTDLTKCSAEANSKCHGLFTTLVNAGLCTDQATCEFSYQKFDINETEQYYLLYQLFGFYWSINVIVFIGQLTISVAIAIWYFDDTHALHTHALHTHALHTHTLYTHDDRYFDEKGSGPSSGVAADINNSSAPMCIGLYHAFITHIGTAHPMHCTL
jgi:hypothetical protein